MTQVFLAKGSDKRDFWERNEVSTFASQLANFTSDALPQFRQYIELPRCLAPASKIEFQSSSSVASPQAGSSASARAASSFDAEFKVASNSSSSGSPSVGHAVSDIETIPENLRGMMASGVLLSGSTDAHLPAFARVENPETVAAGYEKVDVELNLIADMPSAMAALGTA